jgi:hypothetical protein
MIILSGRNSRIHGKKKEREERIEFKGLTTLCLNRDKKGERSMISAIPFSLSNDDKWCNHTPSTFFLSFYVCLLS